MKIKELEQLLGVERANIRYYEREQMISPKRTENRYRDYSTEDVERLKIVILLRKIGISISDIRDVLNEQKSLTDVLKENEQNLMNRMEELSGALHLCRKMEREQPEMDTFDLDYYWEEIHQEEEKGHVFVDICKDYLKYEKTILYSVFGNLDDLAKETGWGRRRKIFATAVIVAYCAVIGFFGVFFLEEDSFWNGFQIPIVMFVALSLLYLPDFLLRRNHPKAAELYKKVLQIVGVALVALCMIWVVVVLLNSKWHFLY